MQKVYYKIILPYYPDTINKVTKFGKSEGDLVGLKKKWERRMIIAINDLQTDSKLPKIFRGTIGIHFKLYFEYKRTRDGDNYTLMCKGLLDAFVRSRMIIDDNEEFVQDNGRRLLVDYNQPRVEIYITEKVPDDLMPDISYKIPVNEIHYFVPAEIKLIKIKEVINNGFY